MRRYMKYERQPNSIVTMGRNALERLGTIYEKYRVQKEVEKLAEALSHVEYFPNTRTRAIECASATKGKIAVSLTEDESFLAFLSPSYDKDDPNNKIKLHLKSEKETETVYINYRLPSNFPHHKNEGIMTFASYSDLGFPVISVKEADRESNKLEAFLGTDRNPVPFDTNLQSQVYCEIANLFIMARQAIENNNSDS